jgi:adenylosuccinate synthase
MVLFEGAQALMLDVDFGTYPYVTSSSPSTGGVCSGAGVAPNKLKHLIGVTKAYCTRVGNGPFVTEQNNAYGETLQNVGHEFGATTGRPRRCGWLDLVALKYACQINGITHLVITKLDVLSEFDTIQVATHYKTENGSIIQSVAANTESMESITPQYQSLEGWKSDITQITSFSDLPINAQNYINFIENYLNVPVYLVSVGPDRSQNIIKNALPLN